MTVFTPFNPVLSYSIFVSQSPVRLVMFLKSSQQFYTLEKKQEFKFNQTQWKTLRAIVGVFPAGKPLMISNSYILENRLH